MNKYTNVRVRKCYDGLGLRYAVEFQAVGWWTCARVMEYNLAMKIAAMIRKQTRQEVVMYKSGIKAIKRQRPQATKRRGVKAWWRKQLFTDG